MIQHVVRASLVVSCAAGLCGLSPATAEDWPMFGRDATRNAVSPEKGAPTDWDVETSENIKWFAPLGSNTLGDPVVAGGLVWVGTNNFDWQLRKSNPDASVLMCLRESDGKLLYKYVSPRLPSGRINDWTTSSMACSPLIERDRMWFVTNRCETVCLDVGPLHRGEEPKVVWKQDMMRAFGVFPHGADMALAHLCSVAGYEDYVYVITGNGVDSGHRDTPSPRAPSLVCLDKHTGDLIWHDRSPRRNILHGQWSSPLVVEIEGRAQVVAPQGDGWVRSFDACSGELIWQFDTNPKDSVWELHGRGTRNNILATPVFHDNHVYIANGQVPLSGYGVGWLYCLDPSKKGDISLELALDADGNVLPPRRDQAIDPHKGERAVPNPNSGVMWSYGGTDPTKKFNNIVFGRTVSNVAVHDDLLIAVDLAGFVHCIDAVTGKAFWKHDLLSQAYGSPLIVDGKVYVGDEDGEVSIFALSREKKLANEIQMDSAIFCSPIFANGVLYIATANKLYAIQDDARRRAARVPRAIFTPTPQDVVEKMLELAEVTANDVVYDLGCGDGRIVITAARKYGCKAVGVEIDRALVKVAVRNAEEAGVAELVAIRRDDLFQADFHDADVVALYLLPIQNEALIPRLGCLKPGSRVLAHEFAIPGIEPDKVISVTSQEDGEARPVYLYTTPLKPTSRDAPETAPAAQS